MDEQRLKKVLHARRLIKSRSEAAANKLLLFITFHAQQQTKKFYVSTAPTFRATLFFISLVERKTERAKRYIYRCVCESERASPAGVTNCYEWPRDLCCRCKNSDTAPTSECCFCCAAFVLFFCRHPPAGCSSSPHRVGKPAPRKPAMLLALANNRDPKVKIAKCSIFTHIVIKLKFIASS